MPRLAAFWLIWRLCPNAYEKFSKALAAGDLFVREENVILVSATGDKRVAAVLRDALEHEEITSAKKAILEALALLGEKPSKVRR